MKQYTLALSLILLLNACGDNSTTTQPSQQEQLPQDTQDEELVEDDDLLVVSSQEPLVTPSTQTSTTSSTTTSTQTTQEDDEEESTAQTGSVVDAPIEGLHYSCGDREGITNANGEFTCVKTPVVFKLGALTVGTLESFTSDTKVYPQDFLSKSREDVEDDDVVELSRFFQTLDDDGDISQTITITPATAASFTKVQSFSGLSSLERMKILVDKGYGYLPRESVVEHLQTNLDMPLSSLSLALGSEDASSLSEDEIVSSLAQEAEDKLNYFKSVEEFIYPNGLEVVAFPEVRSDFFVSYSTNNIPLHTAYNDGKFRVYSYMGEKPDLARYAVLGTNIFKFDSAEGYDDITNDLNKELKNSTTQLFKWLLKKSVDEDIFDENLTLVVNSDYMKSSLEDWLNDNSIVAQDWNITTDTSLLNTESYDIYLAANESTLNYKTAIESHKPVIVFEKWIHPDDEMLAYFDLRWKWYGGLTVGDWDSIDTLCKTVTPEVSIYDTIKNLQDKNLNLIYTDTACPTTLGTTKCDPDLLLDANGQTLAEEFSNGAKALKDFIVAKDAKGEDIFKLSHQYDFFKLALLLGDKYRAAITYPMDKNTTDDTTFYKAYFADYATAYTREDNAYQPDLGDFTSDIDALRRVAPITKTVTMTPTSYSEWSATGLYCPPGKAIKITRQDDSDNVVQVRFNMLRDGTTKIWNTDSYTRPDFIASNPVTLQKGKTYTLSSPAGGPIYLKWDGVEENATSFSVEFENVVEFPSLMDLTTQSITSFTNVIESSPFDWIDIKTPFVEIHTLKNKFDFSYTTSGYFPYDGDLTHYLEDINHYTVLNNLNLAGFVGDDLSLTSGVADWCSEFGLDCSSDVHKKPAIQHINADVHSLCGNGCSGNPFDVDWSVTPTGWGESHEYGHNLQRTRLKIYGSRSTEVSNNIFPLHTNWDYLVDHNISVHPSIAAPKGSDAYAQLQTEIKNGTPATIDHPMWSGDGIYDNGSARLSFYNQITFINGSWDVYTELYIVERLFTQAIKDDTSWDDNKDKLGFSSYTRDEASAIDGNNFMAIALSKFTKKDYRDYFEAWGVELSDKAKDQIDTNGFDTVVPREFYFVKDNKLTKDFPTKTLPLDGVDEQSVTLSGVCSSDVLSECSMLNAEVSFETPDSGSIYFLSQWSENGVTTSTDSADETNTTLQVNAVDSDGNSIVLHLRAAKTTTDDGVDGTKIAMNDTTEVDVNETSLVVWIDADDNNLEAGKVYSVTDPIYINVKDDNTTIRRVKISISDFIAPVALTYNDTTTPFVRGYPEIEDSSTFFVAVNEEQGVTNGVWENNNTYTPLTVKVKDDNGNSFDLKLRARRDVYQTDGESGTYVIMNSGMIYGKDNAFLLYYEAEDNPDLSSGTHYKGSELLIIDAKLWHVDQKLREQMQISVDITTPDE